MVCVEEKWLLIFVLIIVMCFCIFCFIFDSCFICYIVIIKIILLSNSRIIIEKRMYLYNS